MGQSTAPVPRLPAPVAQWGQCQSSVLTGSESPVQTALGAGYLLLIGMVSARGSGRIDGQVTPVSGADRVRLCGHVKHPSPNSAGYLEFPDRTVWVRACATSSA